MSRVYAPSKFDFCGPMSYDFIFNDSNNPPQNFKFSLEYKKNAADELKF